MGLFTAQGKYDYSIFERLTGTFSVCWLRSATTNPTSGATDMGTELANILTFDFGGGLKLDLGAAVFFTGDFFDQSRHGTAQRRILGAHGEAYRSQALAKSALDPARFAQVLALSGSSRIA